VGDFNTNLKLYSNANEKQLEDVGSVLHNKKSRKMWILLTNTGKEFYLKEMAVIIENQENPRLPIYEHHIKIMVRCGLVLIRKKLHNKHMTKFYRSSPALLITTPKIYEKLQNNEAFLKELFKDVK